MDKIKCSSSSEELLFTVKMDLYQQGKRVAADLLAQSTEYSLSRPVKIQRTLNLKNKTEVTPYTPEDALVIILNTGMSKYMYIQTRR